MAWRHTRLVLAIALLLWLAAPHWVGQVDDVYISLAYVHQWLDHGELAWTTGERVEGFSNGLWMLALVPAVAAGVDGALAGQVLSMAGGLLLLVWLHRTLPRDLHGTALLFVVAWWTPLSYWSAQGMETVFFSVLLAAAWVGALRDRWVLVWVAAGLAVICRPEGAAHLGVLGLVRLSRGVRPRRADLALVGTGLGLAAWHVGRVAWFGHFWPTPFLLKVTATSWAGPGTGEVLSSLMTGGGMVALALSRSWRSGRAVLLALLPLALECGVTARVNGDWMGWGRLAMPGFVAAVAVLAAAADRRAPPAWLTVPLALLAVVLGANVPSGPPGYRMRPVLSPVAAAQQYLLGLDTPGAVDVEWLVRRTARDEAVLSADVGIQGNVPEVRVIDSFGLVHRPAAEIRAAGGRGVYHSIVRQAMAGADGIQAVRIAGYAPASPGPPPQVVRRYFAGPEEVRGNLSISHWYRKPGAPPPDEALRWRRWAGLHQRYPAQPWITWHHALSLAEQGDLVGARVAADRHTVRALLGIAGGIEPAISFVDGPLPLVWDVSALGFRLATAAASISRPVAEGDATLHLEIAAEGKARVQARWGRCPKAEVIDVDGRVALALAPCGTPDRVAVELMSGAATARFAGPDDPATPARPVPPGTRVP